MLVSSKKYEKALGRIEELIVQKDEIAILHARLLERAQQHGIDVSDFEVGNPNFSNVKEVSFNQVYDNSLRIETHHEQLQIIENKLGEIQKDYTSKIIQSCQSHIILEPMKNSFDCDHMLKIRVPVLVDSDGDWGTVCSHSGYDLGEIVDTHNLTAESQVYWLNAVVPRKIGTEMEMVKVNDDTEKTI